MNLVCLPFAGGSKYSYNTLARSAPKNIHIASIDLPGRGSRLNEPLLADINQVVDDIFSYVRPLLLSPYAIYGHSMGSLVGYLLTKKIIAQHLPKPVHLFFSGCIAPSVRKIHVISSSLPPELFKKRLRAYGGIHDEVLFNNDLMKFFEPILRADFKVVESFQYQKSLPFDIPIDVFLGTEENATDEDGMAWQHETCGAVSLRRFPGNHFFIFGQEKEIMNIVATKLALNQRPVKA